MQYKTPEKLRNYKKEYMRKRRANPIIAQRIRDVQNKWYGISGRSERQKAYLRNMKKERFFHWRARLFNMHYGTSFNEAGLKSLWDSQCGKCPFTGWALDHTAHLDHIIPIKRGGSSDLTNLRWVSKSVNHMKRDMLDSEFINVIEAIMTKLLTRNLEGIERK